MKVLSVDLKNFALAALCVVPYLVATPAEAFWLFKHKDEKPSTIINQNSQNNYPTKYPTDQNIDNSGRRLVPSYLMNSKSKSTDKLTEYSQVNPRVERSNTLVQDTVRLNSISNTIPAQTSFNYVKTNIKVAIGLNLASTKVVILDGAQLIDNESGEIISNLPAQSEWILSIKDNRLSFSPDKDFYLALKQLANLDNSVSTTKNKTVQTSYMPSSVINDFGKHKTISQEEFLAPNSLLLGFNSSGYTIRSITNQQAQQGLLALNNRLYHGDFLIKTSNNQNKNANLDQPVSSFNVINCVDLEDYLLSVVPSEMPSLWPTEALKAQAIAARSYAVANLGKHGIAGYDLKDNIEDQVYLGIKSESNATNEAVYLTRGLIMRYNGKPICAYFHSCSGGGTERAEHVWHSAVPYLKAVVDFDQEAPLYNWTKNYSILQTESGLPTDIGQVLSITILAKSPSGRATYILLNGSNGSRIISGEAARKYFNLPSTNFNITPVETAYIFAGKGFGHGLGLSQWGAKYLAKSGYNAAQILCYYYDGISIDY